MSEQQHMSIVDMEEAQAPEQARARAVMALQQAGMQDANADTVGLLAQEFPTIGKMEALLQEYSGGVSAIRNSDVTEADLREGAYEELVQKIQPQYEQAALQLRHEVEARRQGLQHQLFGLPESSSPYATGADKHSAQMNYRDALYTASAAKESELGDHVALAEATGDMTMLRAAAAVADMRGNKEIVHRYLKAAGEKAFETYTRRNVMPTESTIGALTSAFAPPRIERSTLAPNQYVLERKQREESQKAVRRAGLFGRR